MNTPTDTTAGAAGAEAVRKALLAFLEQRTRQSLQTDTDLFETGLVSSMFALELLTHLEQNYGAAVSGPDLKLDNFRTVDAMTDLVLRLGGGAGE